MNAVERVHKRKVKKMYYKITKDLLKMKFEDLLIYLGRTDC